MKKPVRILIVEDIASDVDLAKNEICKIIGKCEFQTVETYDGFLRAIETFEPDVVISDYTLPRFDGLKALALTQRHALLTPFIIWTGSMSENLALEFMRAGANNYIFKDDLKRLGPAVVRALEARSLLLARKQAEEEIKERERQLGILLGNLPGTVYRCRNDADFTMEFISDGIEELSGYPAQDFQERRRHFSKMIHPDDQARVWTEIQRAVEHNQPFELVYRIQTATGEKKWVWERGHGIWNAEGQLQALEGFITDITVRKQAEEKYQSIFENSVEGIFQSSPRGYYLNVNPAMARIYGYVSAQEMLGSIQNIATEIYVEPDKRSEFMHLFQTNDSVENFEARNYRKDGSIIWTSTSAHVVRDPNGNVLYYEGSSQDITQRKNAEEALHNNEKRFRALIENGLDDISLLAADGRLLWESPSTIRNLGYEPNEFVGRNIFALMHPEDLEWTRKTFEKLLQEPGGRQRGTFRLCRSDGTWRWVEAIATNMLGDIAVNAIVINYRDITEQKQAEIQLQQKNADLTLINALNELMNRGEGVDAVINLMAKEIKHNFSAEGATVYLLNQDGSSLTMQQYFLPSKILKKIEKLIGRAIPSVEIPVREGGYFHRVLRSGHGVITSDPQVIQKWMEEFVDTAFLPPVTQGVIQKLIPQIYKLLNIKSTILLPLISDGKAIGLLDVSSPNLFTEEDLQRIENIGRQLTIALQRRQVEEMLNEERNLLRTLIDNLPDRIYAMDRQGRKTLSNTADWQASGGKIMEDVIGRTDFDLYPQEMAEEFWHLDKAVLDSGQSLINYEEPGLDADGNRVSVLTTKIPLRDETGKVVGLVGIGRDITERKQAEAERQALLEIVQGLTRTGDLPELLQLVHHSIAKVIYAENFYVCLHQETTGLFEEIYSVDQYDPPQPPSRLENSITSYVFRSGQPLLLTKASFEELAAQGEVSLIGTDSASWLGVPLKTSGRTIGVMAVQDYENDNRYSEREKDFLSSIATQVALVIEHRRAGAALRESEEHYRTIFEGVQDAIFVEALDGHIVMVNERACEMFGYTHEEFLTKTVADLVPPGHPILLAGETENSLSAAPRETINLRANGEAFPIEISGRVQVINDEKVLLVVVRDITERKRAEEEIRRRAEETSALLETSLALTNLDLEATLQTIGNSANQLFLADGCRIFLTEPDGETLRCVLALAENTTAFSGLTIKIGQGVTGAVAASGVAEIVNEMQTDPRAVQVPGTDEEQEAIMFAPLKERERTIGILSVRRVGEQRRFQGAELELLEAFASMAASAVSNARLFEETQSHLAELRASEDRFRQLADNIQEAFWITDAENGKEIYMSPAIETIWGRSVQSMMEPDTYINSIFPEDQAVVLESIEKEKHGEKMQFEYRIVRPDGSLRWIWDRAFPIIDETGRVKRIAGISADITERKDAAEKLRESEERYHSLFQNQLHGSALHEIITDDQGQPIDYIFLKINPAFEKMTGLKAQGLIGRRVTEVLPGIENERLIQIYGRVALTGEPAHLSEYFAPLERYYEINAYATGPRRFAVSFMDVTERRQAEQELRKLSRAVEQSSSTIMITDTSGNIEYVNPKFTQITGYSFEEVAGQNPRILKSGFTSEEEYARLWQTIASGGEWHGELLNKKKDGTLYWESVTISPIMDDRREITHFVGVKEDITERKQNEIETRRHIAELEAVYENGLSVGRLLEPAEIGNRVIETFSRYLPWHHVTIRLRKEESEALELVAFSLPNLRQEEKSDAEQHFVARINRVGQGLSGWVIQTGKPLRTGNVHAHPQYIDTHTGIRSGLYMPLKVGERVIGVISVESEAPSTFTEQDERLLATLANQTAVAFENARLYEAMQKELSERKRVEDALRVSETHYRALADSITDILFEMDQELHYTHWNKASEALTGIPACDAIGKSIEDILGRNEEQARIKSIYVDVLKSHQPRTFETTLAFTGEKRSFDVTAYPSMRGVAVVAKDITDRKRTETIMQKRFELMEYSARHSLKDLMQKTVDEVCELTGSTIGFFHFMEEDQLHLGMQTWSTNALQLFQVSAEDGVHLPLDRAGVWAEAVRQRRPLIQNNYEALAAKKGIPQGHVPILREIVIPIIRNERIMAVMGIGNKPQDYTAYDLEIAARLADYAWDVTERKQMEIALELERNQLVQRVEERTADLSRANSNLARALRVKDEFLANMSHELRTPLNAILGLSESLSEQIAGSLNEKQQKYISTISESGHHLLSLINDILDLAKIDAGHITLDINKVDIRSVCHASLRMIKQLAQKKNQEVSLEIDDGFGLMWADERRLKQMIVNLLGNAVKFTPENGKLGIEVHGDEEANQVSITVWDHGIGIKDADLARLFQPFVQLDSGLAREATGTGLGLALVAQMARLHGGSVNAVSEASRGSRFTIVLPWEPALANDTASRMRITGKFRAIQPDNTNKPTILLVEDTQEVVMMLKDYLELAGYKVFTAQDGIDGIVQASHVKPDLILMDVQMPRMDGFETTRKLRSDPNFRYTPIIALTALAMPHDRERCLEAGMDEYISKPVNLNALVKIIQSCLFEPEPRAR